MKLFRVTIPTEEGAVFTNIIPARSEDEVWDILDEFLYDLHLFPPGLTPVPDNDWTVIEKTN